MHLRFRFTSIRVLHFIFYFFYFYIDVLYRHSSIDKYTRLSTPSYTAHVSRRKKERNRVYSISSSSRASHHPFALDSLAASPGGRRAISDLFLGTLFHSSTLMLSTCGQGNSGSLAPSNSRAYRPAFFCGNVRRKVPASQSKRRVTSASGRRRTTWPCAVR